MHRRHALSCLLVVFVLLASCSGGQGGFLSRAPEESSKPQGGAFCGPLAQLNSAKLDLIRRATSSLEIESTVKKIRGLQEKISAEAPPEVRDDVRLTVGVYSGYLDVLESEGYAKAPMKDITSDSFNKAELALLSYCFQNPTR
ncbi:MAG: hypothetical protein ACR2G7_12425 [Acidimicrobiales bacterium]